VVGKEWNPQIFLNLPVTNVPGCVSRNAKTLGLQHLQLSDVGVNSGPPDRACVVHNWTDELLVEQHAVLNGKTAPPVKERAKHAQTLSRLLVSPHASFPFIGCELVYESTGREAREQRESPDISSKRIFR
jgi:hypothetical protein